MAKKIAKDRPETGVTVHVRMNAPRAIRKELLSIAIATIEVIKKYRAYVESKKNKDFFMKELRRKVAEIKKLRNVLTLEELPLSLGQVEALPRFRKKREALAKMEEYRAKAESELKEEREKLKREIAKPKKRVKLKVPKASKSVDKLQADLDALRRKLAGI